MASTSGLACSILAQLSTDEFLVHGYARALGSSALQFTQEPPCLSPSLKSFDICQCTSWVLGWPRLALGLLLGFLGMLRPSELGRLRRMDIALPQDLNGRPDVIIIAIAQSKTSTRASRFQSTMVTDVNVIALVQVKL
eukprot:1071398-Amphidinium_carterae.1